MKASTSRVKIPPTPLQRLKFWLAIAWVGWGLVAFVLEHVGSPSWRHSVDRAFSESMAIFALMVLAVLVVENHLVGFPLIGFPREWRSLLVGTLRFWGYASASIGLTCLVASRAHVSWYLAMVATGLACLGLSLLFAPKAGTPRKV